MSEGFFIPQEIKDFFSGREGKSLLVKGPPGSGKTCFAFTLLREIQGNGVYLSTRIDPETLYQQISWLKDVLPPERIVDATGSTRKASPSEMFVIRPLKYTDAPEFLRGVYQRTENLRYPVVVIDSWDAVVSSTGHYEPREREKLEHNICDFARKMGAKIVFIAEYTEQKPLDYIVDGVIVMESDLYKGRRIRRMFLQKMRGYPIRHPNYLFSLHNGIFKCFLPFEGFKQIKAAVEGKSPIPDIDERSLSTGIEDLDLLIGGYGSFNLFVGNRTVYELLLLPFIINSLILGKTIILTPSEKPLAERVSSFLGDKLLSRMHFCQNIELGEKTPGSIYLLSLNQLGGEAVEAISSLKGSGIFCFVFASGGEIGDELRSLASRFLFLEMIEGVPCLYGEPSPNQIHALELKIYGGLPLLSVVPIM